MLTLLTVLMLGTVTALVVVKSRAAAPPTPVPIGKPGTRLRSPR
jgi:hypothetical protein